MSLSRLALATINGQQIVIDLLSTYTTPVSNTVLSVDNGDGTYALTGSGVVDNGDGTYNIIGTNVTDNGDGTYTITS